MNKYQKAADTLRKLGQQFRPLLEMEAELERVGSLDQVASEAEARSNYARTQERAAQDSLAIANEALKKAHDEIESARKQALDIMEKARHDAQDVADKITADADAQVSKNARLLNDRVNQVEADLTVRRKELKSLDEQIAVRTSDLQRINTEIESVRRRIG